MTGGSEDVQAALPRSGTSRFQSRGRGSARRAGEVGQSYRQTLGHIPDAQMFDSSHVPVRPAVTRLDQQGPTWNR